MWDHFHAAHGPREAARLFAKILGQLGTYGTAAVQQRLSNRRPLGETRAVLLAAAGGRAT